MSDAFLHDLDEHMVMLKGIFLHSVYWLFRMMNYPDFFSESIALTTYLEKVQAICRIPDSADSHIIFAIGTDAEDKLGHTPEMLVRRPQYISLGWTKNIYPQVKDRRGYDPSSWLNYCKSVLNPVGFLESTKETRLKLLRVSTHKGKFTLLIFEE